MTPALARACERAIHVVTTEGEVLRAGRAALFVLEQLGWRRTALLLGLPPLLLCVEAGYWVVARNRARFARLLRRWPPGYGPDFQALP